MSYHVETNAQSLADLWHAYLWIAERAPMEALKWLDRMYDALNSLEEMPRRCPIAPESRFAGGEVRQLIVGNKRHGFRILFEIEDDIVKILHIRRGSRLYVGESEA